MPAKINTTDIEYIRMSLKDARSLIAQMQGHSNVSIELNQLDKSLDLLRKIEDGKTDKPPSRLKASSLIGGDR